ncbi:hypothetical protein D3C80_1760870 [compost metagenome]
MATAKGRKEGGSPPWFERRNRGRNAPHRAAMHGATQHGSVFGGAEPAIMEADYPFAGEFV